jgi:hypothetical protein
LETAKHKALIEIGASAYHENVRAELHLVSSSKASPDRITNVERLLALSQLITLNALATNLISNISALCL